MPASNATSLSFGSSFNFTASELETDRRESDSKKRRAAALKDPGCKMSPAQKRFGYILNSPIFENTMGIVIIANMFVIIVETDKAAMDNSNSQMTGSEIAGWVILVIFIVELLLRLFVDRWNFWRGTWNKFDFVVVVTDAIFSLASLVLGNIMSLSTLRIFRLCRLARASKVVHALPELRLMVAGLLGSMKAIFWGTVLLAFAITVWAIVAVQLLHPINKEMTDKGLHQNCERCSRAYSDVWSTILTICQTIVAGDSWGQSAIPMIEYQPMTALYFMGVFLTVGMAVLNLIFGVVVNVACQESDTLKEEIENSKRFAKMEAQKHLLKICVDMDTDGSGELSKSELFEGFHARGDFRKAIACMDLEEEDLEILWTTLDVDRSGTVSYNEFVAQVYKLRNSDAQFMLCYIKYYVTIIKDAIIGQIQRNREDMRTATLLIEEKLEHMGQVDADASPSTGRFLQAQARRVTAHEKIAGGGEEMHLSQSASDVEEALARASSQASGEGSISEESKSEIYLSPRVLRVWRTSMDEFQKQQNDFRNMMQHMRQIQHNHERHMSNVRSVLSELLPPDSCRDLNGVQAGPWNILVCGQQRPVKPQFVFERDAAWAAPSNSVLSGNGSISSSHSLLR